MATRWRSPITSSLAGPGKWRTVSLLALAELLAMSVWFSASAVVPQLTAEWNLSGAQQSWLTMSVQVGFVAGALLSACAACRRRSEWRAGSGD